MTHRYDQTDVNQGGPLLQKLAGVCFFSTIIVLSYVATLHIVTNRVEELHHMDTDKRRPRNIRLSGPVSLAPIADVRKVSRPEPVYKAPLHKAKTKKKADRKPASHSKKKKKAKKPRY